MEAFATFFIFIAVIGITALLFGGWVVFSLLRLVLRGIGAIFLPMPEPTTPARPLQRPGTAPQLPQPMSSTEPQGLRCIHNGCHQMNPTTAHFCRRCGRALPTPERVSVRRAAMW
jgi:hypothetical protein